jgi:DNA invertase Pin-like site-specific DNA recombinase
MNRATLITSSTVLPEKINGLHLDKLAVVYVRQSTLQQVEHCRESTQLQYGLADRACRLGWARSNVMVIDEDLGMSGASSEFRTGFQRLVAEVGLGHVGLVLGFEVSRLARSCRDWYQLLEICALAGTLIADSDGVYDPALYNDRLLLGLKGTMSEAELHIMRARLDEGRRHKASRGELGFHLPRGYIRRPSGEIILDPDERVHDTIILVFDVFGKRQSVHGVLRYLVSHGVDLPDRLRVGSAKGELVWRRPCRSAVQNILMSPIYAGAYVYGRRSFKGGRKGRFVRANPSRNQDDWEVLIKNRIPAYIGWERFEENQAQLSANQAQHGGTPRGGPSLLAGLLVCGHCGYRMATCYRTNGRELRYQCSRGHVSKGVDLCQSISGSAIDPLIERLLLAALKPSVLDVSLALAEDIEIERNRDRRRRALRLEQANYEAERAERQFNAIEPENRLVARTLEKRWEEALAERDRLLTEQSREDARTPIPLSPAEKEAIRALAEDIPAILRAATTTPTERKEIARLMLDRVVLTVHDKSEKATLVCTWAGGRETTHAFIRPVRWTDQLARGPELRAAIEDLAKAGLRPPAIARQLARDGWLSADAQPFNTAKVYAIMTRMGLAQPQHPPSEEVERRADEMTVPELSSILDRPIGTLYAWIRKGWLPVRRARTSCREILLVRLEDARSAVGSRNEANGRIQEWKAPSPKLR